MTRYKYRLLFTACLLFPSPSAWADAAETITEWQRVQDPDSAASFEDISAFLNQHPHWPDQKRITIRAERAMRGALLADADILAWYEAHPPISGMGKWNHAEALKKQNGDTDQIKQLVKDAWRDADLTADEENLLIAEFGEYITPEDNKARIERLLWEGKTTPAQRLAPKLGVADQLLAQARIALQEDTKNAPFLIKQVDAKHAHDPGLLFDRLRYRVRKNDKPGIRDILLHAPDTVPYPERWWKIREGEIRRAIDEGNPRMAEKLLRNHAQLEGASFAEALWLDGWLKLEFLDAPGVAYDLFTRMHRAVKTPVSKARAAYWAGRAARKNGDDGMATEWFGKASQHSTAFYGQLAASELADKPPLYLPDEPSLSLFGQDVTLPEDIQEAIRLSIRNGDTKLATRLVNHAIETAENDESVLAVATLGHNLSAPHISVKAAKKAQQQGVVLKYVGYPRPETSGDLPIERPLTLAITRQESEFDPEAESPAGAIGMMQLLPGTAKETAKKTDTPYVRAELINPESNMRLGSHYLSRMINAYDGSYVMAIAAYNAGPGNVTKWSKQFGTPGSTPDDAVNWIEKIPFSETRNYVQRVMENMQVYRALENDAPLAIRDDLVK